MPLYVLTITLLSGLLLGFFIIPKMVELSYELHIYDLPDSRKVHKQPIPRMGGMAFLPIAIITIVLAIVMMLCIDSTIESLWSDVTVQSLAAYLGGALMIYAIGLYDDIHGVGYRTKFLVQAIAASLLCISGLWITDMPGTLCDCEIPLWAGIPFTILFIVFITNAMNLIDGIDGLASGLAIISLTTITLLNILAGDYVYALLASAYIGVLVAFFYFNVMAERHKTFMGDTGSLTLGFTLSFLILHMWLPTTTVSQRMPNADIIAAGTLAIPSLDVIRLTVSRLCNGRNPFLPDKNHIHHKLIRTGLGARGTLITLLALSAALTAANCLMASCVSQLLILITDIIIYALIIIVINAFISRKAEEQLPTTQR